MKIKKVGTVWKGCSLRTRSYINQPQKLEIRKDNLIKVGTETT